MTEKNRELQELVNKLMDDLSYTQTKSRELIELLEGVEYYNLQIRINQLKKIIIKINERINHGLS